MTPGRLLPVALQVAAVRAAVVEGWRLDVERRPEGGWLGLDGLAAHTTGLPVAQWNGAHLLDPAADLTALRPFFDERSLPWGLLVPAELALAPAGFSRLRAQPLMARSLPAPPPVWPVGIEVRADAPAGDVAAVQAAAFEDPPDLGLSFVAPQVGAPWSRFLTAYDGLEPVGTAQAVLAGRSAGIHGVAVSARWRRRGLGAALTAGVLGLAAAAGFRSAHLNPSATGRSVYAALGFADLPGWQVWRPDYLA